MKKSYVLSALALATAMTAFAAPQAVKTTANVEAAEANTAAIVKNVELGEAAPATRAAYTIDDFCGTFNASYAWFLFNGDDDFKGGITITISKGSTPTEVIMTNCPFPAINGINPMEVRGEVDLNTGKVVFTRQDLGVMSNGSTLEFSPVTVEQGVNEEGQSVWRVTDANAPNFTLQLGENGYEPTQHGYMLVIKGTNSGYWGAALWTSIARPDYFKFNESEWTLVGDSDFEDIDFMNVYFMQATESEEPVPSTKVATYRNNANPTQYALRNPYGAAAWASGNPKPATAGDGFIVFDVANEDFVSIRPNTGSGFYDFEDILETYIWNDEGKYIMNGWDANDAWLEMAGAGVTCSSYDSATRVVTLLNIYWGFEDSPLSTYAWRYNDGSLVDSSIIITLPDGAGVEDIAVDENAPVKYFNLQGMEIVNPAKGQVVIKTQGKKATKVVVK